MKTYGLLITAFGTFGAALVLGQAPAPAPAPLRQGPGVQATQDARYREFVNTQCKTPPAQRTPGQGGFGGGGGAGAGAGGGRAGGGGGGAGGPGGGGGGGGARGPIEHRDYTVTAIPGVIAAGAKWQSVWTGRGNNADGIIASDDGGILVAQNTDSTVMKIDKDGKTSIIYRDTNTGGALSRSKNGALFVNERGLPSSVWQLEPKRQILADKYNGEPLDCAGGIFGVVNDLTADSKGGVYFSFGGLMYASPTGVVTRYGTNRGPNGVILSPDEKTLYATGRMGSATPPGGGAGGGGGGAVGAGGGRAGGGAAAFGCPATGPVPGEAPRGSLLAYDVQPDGSLTNERQHAMAGSDGSTIDAEGRIYTTACAWIHVISPDGKLLGSIPAPVDDFISVAFSGPDKKTLYAVANNQQYDEIFKIEMIAQGYKGRAK